MLRTEHVDDQLEIERARLAGRSAELRASAASGARYRRALIDAGLLRPCSGAPSATTATTPRPCLRLDASADPRPARRYTGPEDISRPAPGWR